ncbi:hypothetical protein D8674_024561 [Pyrus ussuriensis x Pyrus communis]|uniref:Uncharacterized protein n=1 Tax=Pyrus ussuriensis x Pyrus communis TaxID=2448454 RepID=A0A5N5H386_9ROSA|nr:hypothetical protein D8674_024561 [Pyrus ussuriensis x Pyrus communis]
MAFNVVSAIKENDSTASTTTTITGTISATTTSSFNDNVNEECDKSGCRRGRPFGKKCSHLVKKQRTKFYIFRRCIALLLCWHERDS